MAKKKTTRSDFFRGLLNLIEISATDLKDEIQRFMKANPQKEVLFDDALAILKKLAYYYKTTDKEIEEAVADAIAEEAENLYIGKAPQLSGDDLEEFRKVINVILYSLAWYPLEKDGEGMTQTATDKWVKEVYEPFTL